MADRHIRAAGAGGPIGPDGLDHMGGGRRRRRPGRARRRVGRLLHPDLRGPLLDASALVGAVGDPADRRVAARLVAAQRRRSPDRGHPIGHPAAERAAPRVPRALRRRLRHARRPDPRRGAPEDGRAGLQQITGHVPRLPPPDGSAEADRAARRRVRALPRHLHRFPDDGRIDAIDRGREGGRVRRERRAGHDRPERAGAGGLPAADHTGDAGQVRRHDAPRGGAVRHGRRSIRRRSSAPPSGTTRSRTNRSRTSWRASPRRAVRSRRSSCRARATRRGSRSGRSRRRSRWSAGRPRSRVCPPTTRSWSWMPARSSAGWVTSGTRSSDRAHGPSTGSPVPRTRRWPPSGSSKRSRSGRSPRRR